MNAPRLELALEIVDSVVIVRNRTTGQPLENVTRVEFSWGVDDPARLTVSVLQPDPVWFSRLATVPETL